MCVYVTYGEFFFIKTYLSTVINNKEIVSISYTRSKSDFGAVF